MLVDFHCHTNCSDGELSPVQLIELAKINNIKVLAITDHDNVDAYTQLKNQTLDDIKLITGIEFSTTWNKIGVHIVGLNFDLSSVVLQNTIGKQKQFRIERAKIIAKKLEKCGLINAYEKLTEDKIRQVGRPDFANLLVEEGICQDFNQAFKKYLGAGKIGDVKNHWLSMAEIIAAVKTAKGTAVLAHPLAYKLTNSKLKRLIVDFKESGGESIEIINGYQNLDKSSYLQKLCKEFKLTASIGSDFHRHNNWTRLGCNTHMVTNIETVWDTF